MLDASEARRLTDGAAASDADVVRSYLKHIEGRIREAAKKGKRTRIGIRVVGPGVPLGLHGLPHALEDRAARRVYRPGERVAHAHPCSRPYTSISW